MKKQGNKFTEGFSLIALGLILLGVQQELFHWETIWPFALIIPGIIFFTSYLRNQKNYGVLMPGTILTVIGVYFLFLIEYGWYHMENFWPIFVLAPGLGFFAMFIATGLKKSYWIPGSILTAIAFIFFSDAWEVAEYWPVILILVGLYLIYTGIKGNKNDEAA